MWDDLDKFGREQLLDRTFCRMLCHRKLNMEKHSKAPLQEKLLLFNKYFEIILKNRCCEPNDQVFIGFFYIGIYKIGCDAMPTCNESFEIESENSIHKLLQTLLEEIK